MVGSKPLGTRQERGQHVVRSLAVPAESEMRQARSPACSLGSSILAWLNGLASVGTSFLVVEIRAGAFEDKVWNKGPQKAVKAVKAVSHCWSVAPDLTPSLWPNTALRAETRAHLTRRTQRTRRTRRTREPMDIRKEPHRSRKWHAWPWFGCTAKAQIERRRCGDATILVARKSRLFKDPTPCAPRALIRPDSLHTVHPRSEHEASLTP